MFLLVLKPGITVGQKKLEQEQEDLLTKGFKLIYNYQFSEAAAVLRQLEQHSPQRPMTSLLGINLIWWQLLSGNNDSNNKLLFQRYVNLLDKKQHVAQSPHAENYTRILAASFRGRYEMHQRNLFQAAGCLRTGVRYMQKSLGQENAYPPYYLTSGLYYYFAAYAKERPLYYPFTFFLTDGNKATGKQYLKTGLKSDSPIIAVESGYFLMMICGELEENWGEAAVYARQLLQDYPHNLWYRYYLFKCLLRQEKLQEAQHQYNMLRSSAASLKDLSQQQREHFVLLARDDLNKYKAKIGPAASAF